MSVSIVTGASRGIGLEITRSLLANNSAVVTISRSVSDELRGLQSLQLDIIQGDVADRDISKLAVDTAIAKHGKLDCVILNHGILSPVGRIADVDVAEVTQNMNINFVSLLHTIQLALPHLRDSRGKILMVSSGAATGAYAAWGAYNASKAAMNTLAKTLAGEEKGVVSLAIRPGVVDTGMQEDIRRVGKTHMPPEMHSKFVELHSQGKLVKPQDTARVYANLAISSVNENLSNLSGQFLSWDGKYTRFCTTCSAYVMSSNLHTDNTKLKHTFENYKLRLNESVTSTAYNLPNDLVIDKIDTQLGYKEFAKRVALNDLFVNQHRDLQMLFFARCSSELVAFTVDITDDTTHSTHSTHDENATTQQQQQNQPRTPSPHYTPLLAFPPLLNADKAFDTPSAASLNSAQWALSDGSGRLFVCGGAGNAERAKELLYNGNLSPFFIHLYVPSLNTLVISTTLTFESDDVTKKTQFDLLAVDLASASETLNDGVLWRLRTLDYPCLVDYVDGEWVVGSASGFCGVEKDGSIEGVAGAADGATDAEQTQKGEQADQRHPPAQYGWSQDDDTVTVSVKLDHIGEKNSYAPVIHTNQIKLPSLNPEFVPLYADVDPEESTWTLNRQLSLLEVDLSKKSQSHVRWVDLFDQSFTPPFGTVDETRSKEDLEEALQSMEKYTQEGHVDGTQEPQLRPGGLNDIPSLAKGEMDDSVDSSVGKTMVMTRFRDVSELTAYPAHQLLSTPLPSYPSPHPSIVISHDVSLSGTLFDLGTLSHLDTFAALPFVMASKRDLRFAYHLSNSLVVVFEGGKIEGAGNAYIYYQCEGDGVSAAQSVVQIGGHQKGALLGVSYFHSKHLLVALCENCLVILSNLI
ncbi:hypothetical protein E3P89_00761 [Wallemia ichthyophaga]|uniref:CS domain-containing protein n=1 Tax=Wallemia ichthyophaga TaxID=245174 RepID=A0A4T0IDE7_WALIC|nr:hypothetical protein E3P93_02187 [Wallemia ichthyophaga]TIB14857.1 hypothetical protein E3P90_01056 [Wallemia ichthyophaga]TIB24799.1 hypothetical protein E3P89_00761 [Wallemia ichthyophaga]TIB26497.1 hypothetical protein E3P88_00925 [Wallemia ichthyophaga]